MSICVLGDRDDYDTFDLGEEWLQARLEAVPPDLMAAVDALMLGNLKVAAHMLGIVLETPKPRTFASFFERLQATDAFELKKHLFACYGNNDSHLSAPDVIERAVRRRCRGQGGVARLPRRVLGKVRVRADPARGRWSGSEGTDRSRSSRAGTRRSSCHTRRPGAGVRRDADAKRDLATSRFGRGVDRARDARLPVRAAPRHSHLGVLPELVDAPVGARLGAQGHEDLLLPDRSRAPRKAPHRARWPASTRRSATRAACGCCGV